jgi:hypothetical protein
MQIRPHHFFGFLLVRVRPSFDNSTDWREFSIAFG